MTGSRTQQDDHYTVLLPMLDNERQLYGCLVDILARKQRAIIEGNLDKLQECNDQEKQVGRRIVAATNERQARFAAIGESMPKSVPEMDFDKVIATAPGDDQGDLRILREELRELLETASRLNKENHRLLTSSLEYTRGMIQLILTGSQESDDEELYAPDGTAPTAKQKAHILDYQA